MRRPVAVIVTAIAAALVACNALTGVGDLVIDSNDTPDGATFEASATPPPINDGSVPTKDPDAGGLGEVDATIVDGCSTTSCETLPDGFQLVVLGDGKVACPTGFGQPFDGVENPTVESSACTCGCDLTNGPSCVVAQGTISLFFSPPGTGACSATGQSLSAGCSTDGFLGPFIAYDRRYDVPQASISGGSCAAKTTKIDAKLKTTNARVCQATVLSQCQGKTCLSTIEKFSTCIASPTDTKCPSDWPTRHLIGTSASFTCGGGCGCNVDGKCSNTGSLSYFGSGDCSGAAGLTYPVGGCNTTPGSSSVFASHRYDPDPPQNPSCKPAGSSVPSAPVLANATTVCCR